MQGCHYDEKITKAMMLVGLKCVLQECHYDEKMAKVMILVGLEFLNVKM